MRLVTAAAVICLGLALGGAILFGLTGGGGSEALTERWVSDTARDGGQNHHAPAVARVDGEPFVYGPISGRPDTEQCDLVAMNGTTGEGIWSHPIPTADCTVHAIADPVVADYDGDGVPEVVAATTQNAVFAFSARDGSLEYRYNLTAYGYPKPIVTDLVEDGAREIVVVDVNGVVSVLRANETAVWTRGFDAYVWADPEVRDFDADDAPEVAIGTGDGEMAVLEADGSIRWSRTDPFEGGVSWMAVGQADGDPATEIVAATTAGEVVLFDGRTGAVQWRRGFGAFAAVDVLADGDGDGEAEVYAVARDGVLRALDAGSGETEWTTTLTTANVQMMPPPRLGDLDGDPGQELAAVTNDGVVTVVDPSSGATAGSYERDVAIWEHPVLADLDGDGTAEMVVVYSDGRVVALAAD